jgi:hypothetical protein
MDPQNVSLLVLIMAAAAWVGMMIVLLVDVFSDAQLGIVWKILWLPVILCLPVVGGLLYGAFSFIRTVAAARAS